MTSDLILRSRLQVLNRNLREVADVLNSVATVREALQQVLRTWARPNPPTRSKIVDLKYAAERARNELGGDPLAETVDTIFKGLRDLEDELYSPQNLAAAETVRRRAMDLQETPVQDLLVGAATDYLKQIRAIQRTYDAASQGDEESREAALRAAWESYTEVLPAVQTLFAEYVDFLAGLAMRDTGYDQGICEIADELVRAYRGFKGTTWKSLSIPARREALNVTRAQIIRIGFPEWSFWALPLAAYGFGLALVDNVADFQALLERVPEEEKPYVRVALADAAATVVMGPAYVAALLLLELDPMAPETVEQKGLTTLRATTALSTLRLLAREATQETPYEAVENALHEQWDAAISQGCLEKFPLPVSSDLCVLVEEVHATLHGKLIGDTAWTRIDGWQQDLIEGRSLAESSIDLFERDGLRQLLNATWLARLNQPACDLDQLARTARGYWNVIERVEHTSVSSGRGHMVPGGPRS